MKEIDWKYVNATPEVSSAFTLEVRNRFDALAKPDDDVETSYNNLISATQEIALEKLPKKKQKEKPLSNHALINVARKAVREAAAKHELNPTRSSLRKLTKAQAQLDEAYVNAEVERIEKKLDQIGNLSSSNQHTAAWPTINDLAGRKSKPSIRIKGESAEKRKKSWLSYFLNLLGGQQPNTLGNRALPLIQIAKLLDISTSTFTIQELEDAIKSLRGNKAPGLDNIPSLIWKDPLFHDLLLRGHIYGDIPPLSQKVIKRRLSFAGHCHRAIEEMIHHVLLRRPRGHVRHRGLTYPDTIARDACMEKEDLPVAMVDREVWRQVVDSISAPRAAR